MTAGPASIFQNLYPRLRDAGQELKALGYLVANQQIDDLRIEADEDVAEGLGKLLHRLGDSLGRLAIELDEAAVSHGRESEPR